MIADAQHIRTFTTENETRRDDFVRFRNIQYF